MAHPHAIANECPRGTLKPAAQLPW